jgi:hypothetical protein
MAHWPYGPTRTDHEETASPALTRVLCIAILVAMLIGLVCGVVWTGYHVVQGSLGA